MKEDEHIVFCVSFISLITLIKYVHSSDACLFSKSLYKMLVWKQQRNKKMSFLKIFEKHLESAVFGEKKWWRFFSNLNEGERYSYNLIKGKGC